MINNDEAKKWRAEKHLYSKLGTLLKGERLLVADCDPPHLNTIGYTSADKVIHINFKHPAMHGLNENGRQAFRRGIFVHELMHQLITDFKAWDNACSSYKNNREAYLFGDFLNILEDGRIENFAPQFVGHTYLKCLRITTRHIYNSLDNIEKAETPYMQFREAVYMFRCGYELKGEFTFDKAKNLFVSVAPKLNSILNEANCARAIKIIKDVFEESRPLWDENSEKDVSEFNEKMQQAGVSENCSTHSSAKTRANSEGNKDNKKNKQREKILKELTRREYEEEIDKQNQSSGESGNSGEDGEQAKLKDAKTASDAKNAAEEAEQDARKANEIAERFENEAQDAKGTPKEQEAMNNAKRAKSAAKRADKYANEARKDAENAQKAADNGDAKAEEKAAKAANKHALAANSAMRSAMHADDPSYGSKGSGDDSGNSNSTKKSNDSNQGQNKKSSNDDSSESEDNDENSNGESSGKSKGKSNDKSNDKSSDETDSDSDNDSSIDDAIKRAQSEVDDLKERAKDALNGLSDKEREELEKLAKDLQNAIDDLMDKRSKSDGSSDDEEDIKNKANNIADKAKNGKDGENSKDDNADDKNSSSNDANGDKSDKSSDSKTDKSDNKDNDSSDISQSSESNFDERLSGKERSNEPPVFNDNGGNKSEEENEYTLLEDEEYVLNDTDLANIEKDIDDSLKEIDREESRFNREDAAPLPDFNIKVNGIVKPIVCLNKKVIVSDQEFAAEQYSKLLVRLQPSINALYGRIKNIFQNDVEEREYRQSGKISQKRLNSGRKTARIFDKKISPQNKSNLAVTILVDQSGSMRGDKAKVARETAITIAEAFSRLNVPLYVMGFGTGGFRDDVVHEHYVTWSNSINQRRRLIDLNSRNCCNMDGYSIRYATEITKKYNAEHKLLIVISDGYPSCSLYNGEAHGLADTADAVRVARRDMDVLGILIDDGETTEEKLQALYGNDFVHVVFLKDLFSKLVRRFISIVQRW